MKLNITQLIIKINKDQVVKKKKHQELA